MSVRERCRLSTLRGRGHSTDRGLLSAGKDLCWYLMLVNFEPRLAHVIPLPVPCYHQHTQVNTPTLRRGYRALEGHWHLAWTSRPLECEDISILYEEPGLCSKVLTARGKGGWEGINGIPALCAVPVQCSVMRPLQTPPFRCHFPHSTCITTSNRRLLHAASCNRH